MGLLVRSMLRNARSTRERGTRGEPDALDVRGGGPRG